MENKYFDDTKLGTRDKRGNWKPLGTIPVNPPHIIPFRPLKLFKYIFKTAKWSGFGNEKVFVALPTIPLDKKLSDEEMYDYFGLKTEERDYVRTN